MKPDEVPDLAAHATAMVDAALVGTDLSRDAFWAAVRKGYNTPYNDPPRKTAAPSAVPANAIPSEVIPVTVVAAPAPVLTPAVIAAEIRAV
ncbi:hypothetical protein [Methylobacterium aerolatum]|uniref:Uncharacterized protein n=1 Tax=Methylobacterium aerolatum TaxID=418708 RepID=A0ABU0HYR9_9HYPH|nr:hypothetical protein [Methylobacterium aerolatum]MDQ0447485.1 hypothetical protein [Methylobacterium aerolatum]